MNMIRSSMIMLFILTIFTGIAYPLMVTGLANIFFHGRLTVLYSHKMSALLVLP